MAGYDATTGENFEHFIPGKRLTQWSGDVIEEQLTEADESGGTLTFSDEIEFIEIINLDTSNDGTFTVNGVDYEVPANMTSGVFKAPGTASDTVTVAGSTDYIVNRRS